MMCVFDVQEYWKAAQFNHILLEQIERERERERKLLSWKEKKTVHYAITIINENPNERTSWEYEERNHRRKTGARIHTHHRKQQNAVAADA